MSSLIYKKIPLIMGEIGAVSKEGYNKHQQYNFRGIEQFYAAAHPVMVKHGVFCVPQVLQYDSESFSSKEGKTSFRVRLTVSHSFHAEDGSCVAVVTAGEGIDTSDKATNKAMSAAMKYAFIELFSIPTQDVADSDRDHVEVQKEEPKKVTSVRQPLQVVAAQEAQMNQAFAEASENNFEPQPYTHMAQSDYVVKFGKYKGQTINHNNIDAIQSYCAWLQDAASKDNKPLHANAVELLNEVAKFLS